MLSKSMRQYRALQGLICSTYAGQVSCMEATLNRLRRIPKQHNTRADDSDQSHLLLEYVGAKYLLHRSHQCSTRFG